MRTLIDCGTLVLHDRIERHRRLLIERGVIRAVAAHLDPPADAAVIDAREHIVLPGFIDIHVHGAMGADVMDAAPDALQVMARFFAAHGVTGFLPTTVTASREDIAAALESVRQAMGEPLAPGAARILGAHVEGPFINPRQSGAQPVEFMRAAQPDEYRPWLESGTVRLITVAPEVDGALSLIRDAQRLGVAVAIGHTDATYDQAQAAFAAGANQATHTFNAMRGLHHREPGALGAVMSNDAVYAQLICDGIHVHPAAVNVLYRCKGADRLVLITDAVEATGLGDGAFNLGTQRIFVKQGVARLESGALAGATLTMDAAFRNIIAVTGCSLVEASRMCSASPARAIGLGDRKGRIAPGYDADIVILDAELRVVRTIVGGQ
ncbi:MAG: N-acetylglucosamine-6-phosphate deacetylase [Thermoflexales bacterium]|nr:N-acetylglucosamine-6-phosphate deacetylase [Thermoflexales bacterium]MDW8351552.1 N-acetylglucosamine-6-phosphate deacetylase [Anaerolineae bacterium]